MAFANRQAFLDDHTHLVCGHLRKYRRRNPKCRICSRYTGGGGRRLISPWRKRNKGKVRRKFIIQHRGWGYGLPKRRPKKVRQNTKCHRKLMYSLESRKVRYLLFRVGQGRMTKLPPPARKIVRDFQHRCYDDYLTGKKFAGKEPLTYYRWRQLWYGAMKGRYGKDVAQSVKAEPLG